MIRIISGKYRGKRLQAPRNLPVRPTTDMAKESLFNILNNHFHLDEVKALDLFSGTGNISYELASRGCSDITAVDNNLACIRFIEKTAEQMQIDGLRVIKADVQQFVQKDFANYDLIFADPPYDYENYADLVEAVFKNSLLSEEGMLVIEHQSRSSLETLNNFQESRKYGNVRFSFFYRVEEGEKIDG